MKHNKIMLVFALVLIASMVLSACQPQTIIETVEVEKVVEKTVQVEVEKVVEQTKIVEVETSAEAFTTPHPILGDLKVRQALAYCTNKVDVARAGYPLLSEEDAAQLVMDTFIPKAHWAYAGDENVTIYPFDPDKGKALLAEAGWSDPDEDGVLGKEDGSVMAIKFTTTTAAFRMAWAAVWEKQMADCGVQILRSHVPASWWFGDTTGLQVRDFELGAYAWVGEADPGGLTLWSCDQIPLPSNNWEGQNYMGWCNDAATAAIKNANNTLIKEDRIANYLIVQQEYTKDVPAIPLFNRTETFSHVSALTGFDPHPGEQYYTYNVEEWEIPGSDTIVLGFTQEPASLFTLVESAYVAALANGLMQFRAWTALDYDFQPYSVTELSTLESGLAQNNEVEAKEGDMVQDASGEIVALAAGVKVLDATGAEVEFTGDPIKMKQLVVKYQFRDDITWQDGSPADQADYELAYKVQCDKESGATSYILCDQMQDITFDGTSYTVTWVPGNQQPLYFQPPVVGPAPSRQPIESEGPYKGMTLNDVPPKDWATLPEVAEMPWSYGPYIIKEWVKGEKMVFEANPYFFKGEVKTPNFVISFVTAENAENQLLGGQVDILGSETLAGLSQPLVDAETAGKIVNVVGPGATWEHIDMNMFIK